MIYIQGQIYQNREFVQGYLGIEGGVIKDLGEGERKNCDYNGVIVPTFTNAHTHIGDSVVEMELKGTIEDIVAPPDGLKHRILRDTPKEKLVESMRRTSLDMKRAGIQYFADFREGGILGVKLLSQAVSDMEVRPKIFGRPSGMKYDENEIKELLALVDGIGLSAISDYEPDDIKRIAQHTKDKKKMFALHGCERVREDINGILDLEPDFLIHMNKATDDDLRLCAENNIPVVLCPRSEVFFGHIPDIPKMLSLGITLALGTDNAMLNSPSSILREMEFAYKLARFKGGVAACDILDMALVNSRKVLNVGDDIRITLGKKANLIVFDISTKEPALALVNGADRIHISMIAMDKTIVY